MKLAMKLVIGIFLVFVLFAANVRGFRSKDKVIRGEKGSEDENTLRDDPYDLTKEIHRGKVTKITTIVLLFVTFIGWAESSKYEWAKGVVWWAFFVGWLVFGTFVIIAAKEIDYYLAKDYALVIAGGVLAVAYFVTFIYVYKMPRPPQREVNTFAALACLVLLFTVGFVRLYDVASLLIYLAAILALALIAFPPPLRGPESVRIVAFISCAAVYIIGLMNYSSTLG